MKASHVLIGLVLVTVIGCAGKVHHRLYDGPALPAKEVAMVKGKSPLILYMVDKKKGPNELTKIFNSYLIGGRFEIALLPGLHILRVGYFTKERATRSTRSTFPTILRLRVHAGCEYTIKAEVSGYTWKPRASEKCSEN